jgi:hypothetical protein
MPKLKQERKTMDYPTNFDRLSGEEQEFAVKLFEVYAAAGHEADLGRLRLAVALLASFKKDED